MKYKKPQVLAEYGEYTAVLSVANDELLDGKLLNKKLKIVQAWIAGIMPSPYSSWARRKP